MSESKHISVWSRAMYVIPLADHFDAILGEPWLLRHSAYLDYGNRCTVLRKGRMCNAFL